MAEHVKPQPELDMAPDSRDDRRGKLYTRTLSRRRVTSVARVGCLRANAAHGVDHLARGRCDRIWYATVLRTPPTTSV